MSEKRKPTIKIIAEKNGKRYRAELFPCGQWGVSGSTYRVRLNGKWVGKRKLEFFTITQITKDLRRYLAK